MVTSTCRVGYVRFLGSPRVVEAVDTAIHSFVASMNGSGAPRDEAMRDASYKLDEECARGWSGDVKGPQPTLTIHDDGRLETNFGGDVSKLGYWSKFAKTTRNDQLDMQRVLSQLADACTLPHGVAPYWRMDERDLEMYRDRINGIPFRGAVTADEVRQALKSPL